MPARTTRATDALGQLDHAYWLAAEAGPAQAAFRRLGFTLDPKPKLQADGAVSTFAVFRDGTYLEIVEDHSVNSQASIASGANPQAAGGLVQSCAATAASLAERGIALTVGQGAGFAYANFPDESLLGRLFFYSHPGSEKSEDSGKYKAFEHHMNGALGLRECWIAVTDLDRATERFTSAGFPIVAPAIAIGPLEVRGVALGWGAHRIALLEPDSPTSPLVESLARIGSHPVGVRLAADMSSPVLADVSIAEPWGDARIVGPAHALGAWIGFGPEGSWSR